MKIFITLAYNKSLYNKDFKNEYLEISKNNSVYYLKLNSIKPIYSNLLESLRILKADKDITHLVFTSKNGANLFFNYILEREPGIIDFLGSKKFLAVGPETAKIINQFKFNTSIPKKYLTSSLADLIIDINSKNKIPSKFLILRSKISNKTLTNKLKKNKIKFIEKHIYTIKSNPFLKKTKEYKLLKLLIKTNKKLINSNINYLNKEQIYLVFTSPSNVRTFFKHFKISQIISIPNIKILPIGPITNHELENYIKSYYNIIQNKKNNTNLSDILANKILKFPENYTLKDCLANLKKYDIF